MSFSVDEFASAGLPLGGARASLFTVLMDTPSGVPNIGPRLTFTCKAASLPSSVLGITEVGYFGRKIKLAGNRVFENWDITVLNDEDFVTRNAFEIWSNAIQSHQTNVRATQLATTQSYRTTAQITQLSKTGTQLRTYEMVSLWPVTVGAIQMDWDSVNQVEMYTVTLAYDYWKPVAPSTTGIFEV
jgi:hypothetical protein